MTEKIEKQGSRIDNFKEDIIEIYTKYGLSLGHEDSQGAFIIENLDPVNVCWLCDAYINENVIDNFNLF